MRNRGDRSRDKDRSREKKSRRESPNRHEYRQKPRQHRHSQRTHQPTLRKQGSHRQKQQQHQHTQHQHTQHQHTHTHHHQHKHHQNTNNRYPKQQIKQQIQDDNQTLIAHGQVCPFMVKIYYSVNNVSTYKKEEDLPKEHELILHFWMDTKLTQIVQIFRAHLPSIRSKQKYTLSRVYEDGGKLARQQMGVVVVMKKNMPNAIDKDARLSQIGFNIGDYIDICATFN